jgi:hypothetical protein
LLFSVLTDRGDASFQVREYLSPEHLRKCWLLSVVPANVLTVLSGLFRIRVVPEGATVMNAEGGQDSDHCFVVIKGKLSLTRRMHSGETLRTVRTLMPKP